jgi:hypothetical protein
MHADPGRDKVGAPTVWSYQIARLAEATPLRPDANRENVLAVLGPVKSSSHSAFIWQICWRAFATTCRDGAKMNRIRLLNLLTTIFLVAFPALAFDANKLGQGGSLPLGDLDGLIGRSAALKKEVAAALADANKTAEEIICSGNRFPSQWVNLGGMRAAPYTCEFPEKWLIIEATTKVIDKTGHVYDTITPAAMKKAVKVTETNPTWKWTTVKPFKDEK